MIITINKDFGYHQLRKELRAALPGTKFFLSNGDELGDGTMGDPYVRLRNATPPPVIAIVQATIDAHVRSHPTDKEYLQAEERRERNEFVAKSRPYKDLLARVEALEGS